MTAGALPATVDVLRELRDAGVRLIGLTNWPAETFPPARDRFDFFAWFEGIVVSGEVGMAKPDEAIFTPPARPLRRRPVNRGLCRRHGDACRDRAAARPDRLRVHRCSDVAARLRRASGLPVTSEIDVRAGHHRRPRSRSPRSTTTTSCNSAATFDVTTFAPQRASRLVRPLLRHRSAPVAGGDSRRPGGRLCGEQPVPGQAGIRPVGRGHRLPRP